MNEPTPPAGVDNPALDNTALDNTALDNTALDNTALDNTALDNTALAELAAAEAIRTPGVARLHPYVVQAARDAVSSVARRATAKLTGSDERSATIAAAAAADPGAIDVDRDAVTGALTLTVRIVATTRPPILAVVRDVQLRITSRVTEVTGVAPVVIVNVLDIDPPAPV